MFSIDSLMRQCVFMCVYVCMCFNVLLFDSVRGYNAWIL